MVPSFARSPSCWIMPLCGSAFGSINDQRHFEETNYMVITVVAGNGLSDSGLSGVTAITISGAIHIDRVNTLRQRRNGQHFADDIFKFSSMKMSEFRFRISISQKFVPNDLTNNTPALAQIMAWRRQATSHYLKQWWLVYCRRYASLGLNELRCHTPKTSPIYDALV